MNYVFLYQEDMASTLGTEHKLVPNVRHSKNVTLTWIPSK